MTPKIKGLFPYGYLQTLIWIFNIAFGVMASSLLNGLSFHVGTGLISLWIMTLLPASASIVTRFFSFVLGLISTSSILKLISWLISSDIPMMSHKVEMCLKCLQLTQLLSTDLSKAIKAKNNYLGFPNCLKA